MTSLHKQTLFIDLETYSSVDIKKSGAFKYIESPDFEILLISYAMDDGPVRLLDLTNPYGHDELPDIIDALLDPNVVKVSHNTAFERTALRRMTGHYMDPSEWIDTLVLAAYNGLPLSLDGCGSALNLELTKIKDGTQLINYFCKPCKPTKANGGRTRNLPEHDPEKWKRFCDYSVRDTAVCRSIYNRLNRTITQFERSIFCLDALINERGVKVDKALCNAAVELDETYSSRCMAEMRQLTGLDNPGSVQQLKGWLADRSIAVESLGKEVLADLIDTADDPITRRVLELRQLIGKTSTKKYSTMLTAACRDDRIRGITQYYGASRTGRWAGRLVQLQNLPQNHLEDIEAVRGLALQSDLESLELLFDSVPDTLSQLIRTALIAEPGNTFLVADFSAIEARVTAYLAGEKWRQEVFASGGDIYCASASQMFHVPVEKHGINSHLRQKGKIAELALGYGGGVGAMLNFGADKMGMSEDEMQDIVKNWRAASPTIPKFWRDAETAARSSLEHPGRSYRLPCGVSYIKDADALRVHLPSGRWLSYWGARIDDGSIVYMGTDGQSGAWTKKETWGGKLVENIVQAYARDCLAVAMARLDAAGYNICFHVHDEVVIEAPEGSRWQDVAAIMGQPIDWAPGLVLRADGYETPFYKKD